MVLIRISMVVHLLCSVQMITAVSNLRMVKVAGAGGTFPQEVRDQPVSPEA